MPDCLNSTVNQVINQSIKLIFIFPENLASSEVKGYKTTVALKFPAMLVLWGWTPTQWWFEQNAYMMGMLLVITQQYTTVDLKLSRPNTTLKHSLPTYAII